LLYLKSSTCKFNLQVNEKIIRTVKNWDSCSIPIKNIKPITMKIISFFTFLLFATITQAQSFKVLPGTDLTIIGGTVFKAEGFAITPSANFIISNNSLVKSTTVIHSTLNNYIARVYQFANTTNPFSGSVQMDYTDGAELNGIPEGSLTLNAHDGTSWNFYPATTRDGTNNFVLTNGLSAVSLNELTLADLSAPLPLVWVSFTAIKQNKTVLLQWTTAQEQNTRNFAVQHSGNGINWISIGVLPAAGSSTGVRNYSYVHTSPVTGMNYYRILQTDIDNQGRYSDVKAVRFSATDEPFTIIGNPVSNNILTIQVNITSLLALYSTDGKMVWQEQLNAGTKYIDVSRYAKGAYLLKANSTVQKVMIQ
jgi:hypothetical protein